MRLTTILIVIAIIQLACSGCVRRRLTIRSNPPGAVVYVDRQPVGVTPVSTKFTYYGTRHIELVRDGYETTAVHENFNPRWYQIPPLDFISETLWPGEIRDERVIEVQMQPQRQVPTDEIIERGEQLRQNTVQGIASPIPQVR